MRLHTIALLTIGVTLGACDRATPSPQPGATRSPDGSTAPEVIKPAGTAGAADSQRTASPSPVREVTLPAGTRLPVVLDTTVGSDVSRVEQAVHAHLSRPITLNGVTVLPDGSALNGVVTGATRSGRVKGRAHIAMRFDTVVPRGEEARYKIQTLSIARTAAATKKKDALEIGAPAAGGALIGAVVGGKKGALIGAAAGGGTGTAVVLSTRGREVRLARGTALLLKLAAPVTIRVRG